MAKASKNFTYKVVSRSGYPFPIDMLRYDDSIPASEVDSHKIIQTFDVSNETKGSVIELRYCGQAALTQRRWLSFGWELEGEQVHA